MRYHNVIVPFQCVRIPGRQNTIRSGIPSAALLLVVCLLLFSACGVQPAEGAEPEAIATAIVAEQLPEMTVLRTEDAAFSDYLAQRYGISPSQVERGAICVAGGVEAAEVTVLLLKDAAAAETARLALEDYRNRRVGVFTGYAPEQAALVEAGAVLRAEAYAALLICPDPDTAARMFRDGARGEFGMIGLTLPSPTAVPVQETPPEATDTPEPAGIAEPVTPEPEPTPEALPAEPAEDSYQPAAVLDAWRSGDDSGLTEKNRAILAGAREILGQLLREGMGDYEKELAVHDWIVDHTEYDPGELSSLPWELPDPDNDNPYGVFYSGKAICLGYSSTFQMFMDMLGIECITVHGTVRGGEEHAWNMVRLEGEWYCVDVTWDDPIASFPLGPAYHHTYFNVSSDWLRNTDHHWDEADTPEATATALAWRG